MSKESKEGNGGRECGQAENREKSQIRLEFYWQQMKLGYIFVYDVYSMCLKHVVTLAHNVQRSIRKY